MGEVGGFVAAAVQGFAAGGEIDQRLGLGLLARLVILGRLVGSGRLLGSGMRPPRCGEPFAQIKGWLVVTAFT